VTAVPVTRTDAVPITGAASVRPAPAAPSPELVEAARAFEAIFLRQMIGAMRQAELTEGLFSSQATDAFRDMGDANLADNMASKGQFGIADMLTRQFAARAPAPQPTQSTNQGETP
jgi:peptidoglycan hydrolase FlgJ